MLDKSFGILFYLKKPKNYVKGDIPIYLRITVDSIPKELSVKRSCDPGRWISKSGKASGTKEDVKALNAYLDVFERKVFNAKQKLIEQNQMVTAEAIKDILLGKDQRNKMLIKIFADYNDRVKKLIGIDYAEPTWEKYDRTRRFTHDFIQWKYKTDDIHIKNLDFEFVCDFELWLKTVRKCGQNASLKYISILKMVIFFCMDSGWLGHDPFVRFKRKKEEVIPVFLSKEEIQKIAEKVITIDRISQVRDVYIFCCFTGLSYIDVKKLNSSEVSIGIDNELWIFTDRQKTEVASRIPLLPVTLKILERYKDHPHCVSTGKLLPVLSNQKYNAYLKEIADICGIRKNLTTHTARHTFGTTVTLSNGVPIESVSKMLGHKKIQTTQHYARVLDTKVSEDMKLLKAKLSDNKEAYNLHTI